MRLALLMAFLLAGCASTTEIVTRSVTPHPPGEAASLLLVAQTPEGDTREIWELTCQPVFQRLGLEVYLSHQELPLWDNNGRAALSQWASEHGVQRVLVVNLTHLLMQAPHLTGYRDLNPINQEIEEPTWRIGIGGDLKEPPEVQSKQTFPADLLDVGGRNLWSGMARTHEANDQAAIAKSQCRALAAELHQLELL